VELPNGARIDDYYVFEKKSAAIIVAMDKNNNLIIKKEYRYPIDEFLYELPGGTIEELEEPLQTAKRELLEETGYEAKEWKLLGKNYDYPTKDTNCVYIYLAKDICKVAEQNLEISEDIEMEMIPLAKAISMCVNGEINVNGSVAGILLAQIDAMI
jgi:8-oxo-dGTP pyrophosphatase MutT (NUDIX family)